MNNKVILSPPEAKDIKLSSGQSLEENINNLNNAIRELQNLQVGGKNLQVGGRNLYLDTKNFSRPSVWANYDLWQKTGETYNGFTVISSKSGLDGTCQEISAKEGEVYTFSAYIKNVDSVAAIYPSNVWDFGSAATSPAIMTIPQSTDFVRHAFTFRVTRSGIIAPGVGRYEVKTNKIEVCGLKLERGNVATDWTPAPEDMKLEPYPVGSIYLSVNNTSPSSLFGGTWEQIAQGRCLMGVNTGQTAGTNVSAGLPNITGIWSSSWNNPVRGFHNLVCNGAFYRVTDTSKPGRIQGVDDGAYNSATNGYPCFDASRSNKIYGNSSTVQPPALLVYIFKRVS